MRPKPLMATFTAASVVVLTAAACAWRWAGRTVSVEDAGERTIRNAGRSPSTKRKKPMPRRTLTALPRLRPAVLPRNSTCIASTGQRLARVER